MANFFIKRPIFAIVVALVITIAGALCIFSLPIDRYPKITPPQVSVHATYPGADSEVVAQTVAEVIEKNVVGAEGFDNIILDPGFGFGKTLAHNYELMNGLEHFQDLGYPLLVGISRKSMIYKLLGNSPAEALNGTAVLNTVSLLKGANILRVHDVGEACEAVKIFKALSGEM